MLLVRAIIQRLRKPVQPPVTYILEHGRLAVGVG